MEAKLGNLLSNEEIESIRQPIENALTLPARAFTDESFYQLEIDKIYKKNWVAALFEFDAAKPGDIKPFEICEIPLLAIRGDDNKLRVFHNICPYDGCLAATKPATTLKKVVTPYHGWTYDLQGKLIETPYWDGSRTSKLSSLVDKEIDLVPVATDIFMNTVFVNLSDSPQPFQKYLAPIHRALMEYDLETSEAGLNELGKPFVKSAGVKSNWKTVFENACINVLHENFVHDLYAASPEVPRIKEDGVASFQNVIDEKFMALAYRRVDFRETYPPVDAPHLGKDPGSEPETETFGTLYPNFYISASSQFIEVGFVLPQGPGESTQSVIYHFEKDVARAGEAFNDRQSVSDGFYEAFVEDSRICEAVQRARRSPVYQQKFYAPFWDKMHHYFTNLILDDLEM